VNSYGYNGVPDTMYGPYFDNNAVSLYNFALNRFNC